MPPLLSGCSTNMNTAGHSPERDTSFDITGVRRVSQQPVPLSYAYGAPPSPSRGSNNAGRRHRSGSAALSTSMSNARFRRTAPDNADDDDDVDGGDDDLVASSSQQAHFQGGPTEPAAVRYARLKQRKQALGSTTLPVDAGRVADSQEPEDTESAKDESGEISIDNNNMATRQDGQLGAQRGRGPSILQQSERPTVVKDTSVQIASAFQQAAVVGNGVVSGSQNDLSRRQDVAFLSRAGDRCGTLADSGMGTEFEDVTSGQDDSGSVAAAPQTNGIAPTSSLSDLPPSSGSKKRKKPSSTAPGTARPNKGRTDGAYRPSKAELAEMSSDEFEEDDENIDPSELYTEMGFGTNRSKQGMSAAAKTGKPISRKKPKASKKIDPKDNNIESAAPKRRPRKETDGEYDQSSQSSSDDLAYNASGTRTRRRKNGTPHPAAPGDPAREGSAAPSAADTNVTSYYLHEPSAEPEAIRIGMTQPGAGRLVQTQPLSNSYQPAFAYSTVPDGSSGATAADKSLRARRASLSATGMDVSLSAQSDVQPLSAIRPGHLADLTKTSSNASFNERGSDYDYAEEERMANALLAQKERQRLGLQPLSRGFPEGRPATRVPDFLSSRAGTVASARKAFERERERDPSTSSDISLTSAQNYAQQRAAQRQAQPLSQLQTAPSISVASSAARRAPAPPIARTASIISAEPEREHEEQGAESVQSTQQPHQSKPQQQRIGQRLGRLLRQFLLLLYWVLVKPVSALLHADKAALLKWAGGVALLSLILASMYEHDTVPQPKSPSRWHWPFGSTASKTRFTPPSETPGNIDELVARLTSLEQSLASLSSAQSADRNSAHDRASAAAEVTKRLSVLEADFEGERRKVTRAHDALVKAEKKHAERTTSDVETVKSQLDSVSTSLKQLAAQQEASRSTADKFAEDLKKSDSSRAMFDKRLSDLSADIAVNAQTNPAELRKMIDQAMRDHAQPISVDSKTGEVQIHPSLLKHLQQVLPQGTAGSAKTPSWTDFLAQHEKSLKKSVDQLISEHASSGALLDQAALRKAVEKVRADLADLHKAELTALAADVDNKMSKMVSSAGKSTSIKLNSGEDLRTIVNGLIDEALSRYRKDVLAQPDFALYSAGARVIPSLTSPTYSVRPDTWTSSLLARLSGTGVLRGLPPVTALHPDTAVGRCWAFAGQTGQLGILLSRDIYPSSITIEHASKDLVIDVSSAPKRFEVWGIVESKEGIEALAATQPDSPATNRMLLMSDAYDAEASNNIQTFHLSQEIQNLHIPITTVVLHILDNHGNTNLSCLYRIRVGGRLAPQTSKV